MRGWSLSFNTIGWCNPYVCADICDKTSVCRINVCWIPCLNYTVFLHSTLNCINVFIYFIQVFFPVHSLEATGPLVIADVHLNMRGSLLFYTPHCRCRITRRFFFGLLSLLKKQILLMVNVHAIQYTNLINFLKNNSSHTFVFKSVIRKK